MDVLHAQFNSGHLSLEEIKTVLGSDFGTAWPALLKKFKVDPTGKFFNERLEVEQVKRAAFTASRQKNLKSHKEKHIVAHMENVNRDKNKDSNGIEGGSGETLPPGPKPPEDDLFEPLTDAWFDFIFDELYLERMAMAYPNHDIADHLRQFKAKVIGSPSDYVYRDTDGIRKAFAYQLRTTKAMKQKNGIPRGTLEEFRNL